MDEKDVVQEPFFARFLQPQDHADPPGRSLKFPSDTDED